MKKTGGSPIKVALYGMDPRSYKTMELYLKGPCKGIAVVVGTVAVSHRGMEESPGSTGQGAR